MKAIFDDDIVDNEVDDLNINNEDILHLNDGGDLNRNIGEKHGQENQHNHFGGPILEKHQPEHHLEGHNERKTLRKKVTKLLNLLETVISSKTTN